MAHNELMRGMNNIVHLRLRLVECAAKRGLPQTAPHHKTSRKRVRRRLKGLLERLGNLKV